MKKSTYLFVDFITRPQHTISMVEVAVDDVDSVLSKSDVMLNFTIEVKSECDVDRLHSAELVYICSYVLLSFGQRESREILLTIYQCKGDFNKGSRWLLVFCYR